jgi:hypothetical protein
MAKDSARPPTCIDPSLNLTIFLSAFHKQTIFQSYVKYVRRYKIKIWVGSLPPIALSTLNSHHPLAATATVDGVLLGTTAEAGKTEPLDVRSNGKKWNRFIPFTRSWKEQRKARKTGPEIVIGNDSQTPEDAVAPSLPPEQQPEPEVVEPLQQKAPPPAPATRVATLEPPTRPQTKTEKILAQYGHHDNKGAVGWTPPEPSVDRPYPVREYVGGKKVLAQYAHHDNKGAVGWTAPAPSADRPYPIRQTVGGKKVLAQYGHHDNKWAVKHPVY